MEKVYNKGRVLKKNKWEARFMAAVAFTVMFKDSSGGAGQKMFDW